MRLPQSIVSLCAVALHRSVQSPCIALCSRPASLCATILRNLLQGRHFNSVKYLFFLLFAWNFCSCSTTKFVPNGEYLLEDVKIESDVPEYKMIELSPYIKQYPNYKMFGVFKTMFHVYNLAGKDSTKWLNRLVWKMGEAPILFDSIAVYKTESELKQMFFNMGYLCANISSEVSFRGKKAYVTYHIQGNTPYRIHSYDVCIEDSFEEEELYRELKGDTSFLLSPYIKQGMLFDRSLLNTERERITALLHDRGYFAFSKENIAYDADTAAGVVDLRLRLHIPNDTADSNMDKKFYYDSVFIYSDCDLSKINRFTDYPKQDSIVYNGYTVFYTGKKPSLKLKTLLDNCFIVPKESYSQSKEELTYTSFSALNALSNVYIQFAEKMRNDSALLDCHIFTIPVRYQTVDFSVEGTNTSGNFGIASSSTYVHRNLFGGSELFNFRLRGAYEAVNSFSNPFTELGGEVSVRIPKFLSHFVRTSSFKHQTSTEFSLQYNHQSRSEYDRVLLSAALQFQWKQQNKSEILHQINVLNTNYIYFSRIADDFLRKLPPNAEYFGYTNQFVVGTGYNFLQMPFNHTYTLRLSIESAGNTLYVLSSLFNWRKDTMGVAQLFNNPFAQFVKIDFDYSARKSIDRRNTVAYRIGSGVAIPYGNSQMLPFEKRYYSGGANSLRAWKTRELGPGSFSPCSSSTFYHRTGNIKLDLNVEYRTQFFWKFEFAAFLDAGNIWTNKDYPEQDGGTFAFRSFFKEVALDYGVGLRLNLDYFVVRLDCAEKAYDPAKQLKYRWTLLHPNFGDNFNWHVAIGYPF